MNLAQTQKILLSSSLSVFLIGCGGAPNYSQSEMHVTVEEVDSHQPIKPQKIPSLVKASPTVPTFSSQQESDTFDVVVTAVPVRDLLFALARDAEVNMDIDDSVGGYVSISALDQTLDAILARIAEQVDIRIEYLGDAIIVKSDEPYFKRHYVDYLAVSRSHSASVGSGGIGDAGEISLSSTFETDFWQATESAIAAILEVRIADREDSPIVAGFGEEDKESAEGISSSETRLNQTILFDVNRDQGIILVRAPHKLQKEVEAYLDSLTTIAHRQVLLEATVVEVVLNNQYKQGIDWSLFNHLAEEGLGLYQGGAAGGAVAALNVLTGTFEEAFAVINPANDTDVFTTPGAALRAANQQISSRANTLGTTVLEREVSFEEVEDAGGNVIGYRANVDLELERTNDVATARSAGGIAPLNPSGDFFSAAYRKGDLSAAVQLLDRFGDSKVLSSPRISALNNQPAVLRVVDQEVYFDFTVNDTINEDTGGVTGRTIEVDENVVDIGFVLNVIPNVSAKGEIMLSLKPTVTRVIDYRRAPTVAAAGLSDSSTQQNLVPITRVRELESLISLRDGEVAVLGGLLEDRTTDVNTGVPGLSSLPGIGSWFENKDQSTFKTEFVVFLRAKVITNPSLNGDYSEYRNLLPNSDFIIRDADGILVPDQKNAR